MFGRNGKTAPNLTEWDDEVVKQIASSLDANEWIVANTGLLAECSVRLTFSSYGVTVHYHRPITVVPPIIPIVKSEKQYSPPPPPPIGGLL